MGREQAMAGKHAGERPQGTGEVGGYRFALEPESHSGPDRRSYPKLQKARDDRDLPFSGPAGVRKMEGRHRPAAEKNARGTEPRCSRPFCSQGIRSEEHTSELQSLMRISYAVLCLTKKTTTTINP